MSDDLLRELRTELYGLMEQVDLHSAETMGSDVCDCELPNLAGDVANKCVGSIDAYLNRTHDQGANGLREALNGLLISARNIQTATLKNTPPIDRIPYSTAVDTLVRNIEAIAALAAQTTEGER